MELSTIKKHLTEYIRNNHNTEAVNLIKSGMKYIESIRDETSLFELSNENPPPLNDNYLYEHAFVEACNANNIDFFKALHDDIETRHYLYDDNICLDDLDRYITKDVFNYLYNLGYDFDDYTTIKISSTVFTPEMFYQACEGECYNLVKLFVKEAKIDLDYEYIIIMEGDPAYDYEEKIFCITEDRDYRVKKISDLAKNDKKLKRLLDNTQNQ